MNEFTNWIDVVKWLEYLWVSDPDARKELETMAQDYKSKYVK